MAGRFISAGSIALALLFAASAPALSQSQAPRPGQSPPNGAGSSPQRAPAAPPQAAPRPYKPVAITAPASVTDPSFEAFRTQLGEIAEKKDRKALAGLVAPNFFWLGEKGDRADKKRPAIDNLAKAIQLDSKDAEGWDLLLAAAADPTGMPMPQRKDTICAPADPGFDTQALEALAKSTGTDIGDWAYPTQAGLEVRSAPQPNSPVVEKLGMHFVRVIDDDSAANAQVPMLHVVAPSGKVGYLPADALSPLGSDQLCYGKDGGNWKIVGFVGSDQ